VPPAVRDDSNLDALGSRLLVDSELRRAAGTFFRLLDAAGIRAAPMKGIALSVALYDDPLERPFGDIDVLVAYRDVGRVKRLARRAGFGLLYDSRRLGSVNVVIPPGFPVDVHGSIGPPGFSALTARDVLGRASLRKDPRVCDAKLAWLDGHDHLLILLMDAMIDKLASRVEIRLRDLARALRAWVASPESFAAAARRAGLGVVASTVLRWVVRETGDATAARILDHLHPLPPLASRVADWLIESGTLRDAPRGIAARVGVRLVADDPLRVVLSLGLGAVGVARFRALHGSRPSGWTDELWRGPERR
jgi:hypothetical protein